MIYNTKGIIYIKELSKTVCKIKKYHASVDMLVMKNNFSNSQKINQNILILLIILLKLLLF